MARQGFAADRLISIAALAHVNRLIVLELGIETDGQARKEAWPKPRGTPSSRLSQRRSRLAGLDTFRYISLDGF